MCAKACTHYIKLLEHPPYNPDLAPCDFFTVVQCDNEDEWDAILM